MGIRDELREVAKLMKPKVKLVFVRSVMAPNGGEFIDDAWDEAQAKIEKGLPKGANYMESNFLIVTSYKLRRFPSEQELAIQHCLPSKGAKELVRTAFEQVFGKRFRWDGKKTHTILIKGGGGSKGRAVEAHGTRRSPAESATKYPVGTRKRGLNGSMWRITSVKGGVNRWVPAK